MIIALNIFLFIVFIGFVVELFVNGFSYFGLFSIIISALVAVIFALKMKLYSKNEDLNFLNINIYSLFLKKYFFNFFKMIICLHKPFKIDFDQTPALYKVEIPRYKNFDSQILIDIINLSNDLTLYKIEKNIAYIYSLNEKSFANLNLVRLSKDLSQINENSIV